MPHDLISKTLLSFLLGFVKFEICVDSVAYIFKIHFGVQFSKYRKNAYWVFNNFQEFIILHNVPRLLTNNEVTVSLLL